MDDGHSCNCNHEEEDEFEMENSEAQNTSMPMMMEEKPVMKKHCECTMISMYGFSFVILIGVLVTILLQFKILKAVRKQGP